MYVISSFDHSTYLELAISELEAKGIARENILAVPLEKRKTSENIIDSIDQPDGISLLDAAFAWATAFAVLGASYGFILPWGPIIWGLAGAVMGFFVGFGLDALKKRRRKQKFKQHSRATEVVLLVHCDEHVGDLVEKIMWDHFAFGVSRLRHKPQDEACCASHTCR